ncbi:hypothetical protein OJ997_32820 [Solirubrobacter phytolaccae]|uniref:Uncharacterized protein n=1 Tax=Solirubrobacter phytolaccae TaxID=1404360 RepID=A0A9X3SB33_9ACTN|nr:hypothetical protein [Solirubrobacter phytolaccae]MDA0185134.1 hypothetical protein [Solirubrobacter phytolaccae]
MTWWEYAMWGGFGGLAVEFLEFRGSIRRTGDWPWRRSGELRSGVLACSVAIRVGAGIGLAVAAGDGGHISGVFGALAIGVAAPYLLEQLARQVPVRSRALSPGPSSPTTMAQEARVHVND